jgi:tetratricopeptide (TPR) repeat protein
VPEPAATVAAPPLPPAQVEPPPFEIEPVPVQEVQAAAPAPVEFEIPLVDLDASAPESQISANVAFGDSAAVSESAAVSGELDLSDEWAAISGEAEEISADATPQPDAAEIVAPLEFDPIVEPEAATAVPQQPAAPSEDETIAEIRRAANEAVAQLSSNVEIVDEEPDHATGVKAFEIDSNLAQTDLTEDAFSAPVEAEQLAAAPEVELDPVVAPAAEIEAEPSFEIVEEPVAESVADAGSPSENLPPELLDFLNEPAPEVAAPAENLTEAAPEAAPELEIELTPEPALTQKNGDAKTTDDFLSELAAEFDDLEAPAPEPTPEPLRAASNPRPPAIAPEQIHSQLQGVFAETPVVPPAASSTIPPPPTSGAIENMNELAEVFQEFRSELGEMGDEDEDLETHYNLGIAYREMGLLDEAIGEFQKVAKAIQKGKPFRYEMNCSTMLGLSFMDKGEPMVASLWYKRALSTPHLEEESILALQYDLGLALESAGEADAALDSFRQVYAANIDYRDVADRIATLQKQ